MLSLSHECPSICYQYYFGRAFVFLKIQFTCFLCVCVKCVYVNWKCVCVWIHRDADFPLTVSMWLPGYQMSNLYNWLFTHKVIKVQCQNSQRCREHSPFLLRQSQLHRRTSAEIRAFVLPWGRGKQCSAIHGGFYTILYFERLIRTSNGLNFPRFQLIHSAFNEVDTSKLIIRCMRWSVVVLACLKQSMTVTAENCFSRHVKANVQT